MLLLECLIERLVVREHSVLQVREGQMQVLTFNFKTQGFRFGVPQ